MDTSFPRAPSYDELAQRIRVQSATNFRNVLETGVLFREASEVLGPKDFKRLCAEVKVEYPLARIYIAIDRCSWLKGYVPQLERLNYPTLYELTKLSEGEAQRFQDTRLASGDAISLTREEVKTYRTPPKPRNTGFVALLTVRRRALVPLTAEQALIVDKAFKLLDSINSDDLVVEIHVDDGSQSDGGAGAPTTMVLSHKIDEASAVQ